MQYEIVNFEGMTVTGQSVKTSNAENRFGELWQQFLQGYDGKAPAVAVYSNYESDFRGKFDFTIGTAGDKGTVIPAGQYLCFTASRDKVGEVWQQIWASDIARAYGVDFELYEGDSVSIYIGADLVVAPCGLDCRECDQYPATCGGCRVIEGKPFWLPFFNLTQCALYECSHDKGVWDCGCCGEMPCKKHYDTKDPSLSDEQHVKYIEERAAFLKGRRK